MNFTFNIFYIPRSVRVGTRDLSPHNVLCFSVLGLYSKHRHKFIYKANTGAISFCLTHVISCYSYVIHNSVILTIYKAKFFFVRNQNEAIIKVDFF